MMERFDLEALPIVAIDRIVEVDEAGIRTLKAVTIAEALFAGHYPGQPIYPGVFTLEGFHQSVRAYVARQRPQLRARLSEIRSLRLLRAVTPGARLELDCRCTFVEDKLIVDASCRGRDGATIAEAKLRYALEPA